MWKRRRSEWVRGDLCTLRSLATAGDALVVERQQRNPEHCACLRRAVGSLPRGKDQAQVAGTLCSRHASKYIRTSSRGLLGSMPARARVRSGINNFNISVVDCMDSVLLFNQKVSKVTNLTPPWCSGSERGPCARRRRLDLLKLQV